MKSNYSYEALRPIINEFLRQKIAEIEPPVLEETRSSLIFLEPGTSMTGYRQLLEEIGVTDDQFAEIYLTPWRHLSHSQMQKVMNYWNLFIGRSRAIHMSIERIYEYRALHWTIVNVYNLHLPGLTLFLPDYKEQLKKTDQDTIDLLTQMYIAPEYGLPFKQCEFCGRKDTDTRRVHFSSKLRFCHTENCSSSPNSSDHDINCCYGQWHQIQKNFSAGLKRADCNDKKITECFLKFLENRYHLNKRQKWDVRPKEHKNKEWQMLFESTL